MRNFSFVFLFLIVGCTFVSPTEFSTEALNTSFIDVNNSSVELKEVLSKHHGKKIVVNVWASWCKDCIVGIPKLKKLQKEYPDVVFVFVSQDKNIFRWKKALKKYQISGDHYYVSGGMNNGFGDFLNSNWIPRYLVVNENGFVDLFKAAKVTDPNIVRALKK